MKVLLTGYAGFLGRHIANLLVERGWEARVVLHSTAIRKRDLKPGFEVLWGSISDPALIRRAVQGVDAIIHSAWVWPHAVAGNDSVNLDIVRQLWEASVESGVSKFVFISSVAVYGMEKRSAPIDESQPVASGAALEAPYPRHKVQVEQYLLSQIAEGKSSPKLAIFRPGVLIDRSKGPGKQMALGKTTLALGFGNGRNRLPFISASDTADAIVRWIASGKESSVYNVTPTRDARAREWYRRWGARYGKPLRPFFIRAFVMLCAGFGITVLKRLMGKPATMLGYRYAMASATRDLRYSNERLRNELGWKDTETLGYFEGS